MDFDQEKTQDVPNPGSEREYQQMREAKQKHEAMYADCGTQACRPLSEKDVLEELFTYHRPTPITLPKFAAINQAAKNFAEVVLQNCPRGADRADVIRSIQDARMTANRSVALNGLAIT